jgi:nitrogen-specific signal transduction histidine kinase/ActR/RegA family two-component response regulator
MDVTERKRLESQLQQSQKMEAIATLAGGIAHQFNNALSPIMAGLDLIEVDLPEGHDISQYTEMMRSSAHRMSDLTSQLLAYARGGQYQAKVLYLRAFIRDTLPIIEHSLKPSVHVETDLPDDIMSITADMTQMQMVLSAVLSNASEAMEDQGRIRIACRNRMITDDSSNDLLRLKPGPYVHLKIEDDGKGMDKETAAQIFEPFYTTKFQGRGLGMAAVYGIIKNHNGSIFVDSTLGKGTTVHIYIPAIDTDRKEGTVTDQPSKLGFDNTVVLVIEDEEFVMEMTVAMLEKIGCSVLQAKTGAEAVDIAKTHDGDIDLAILDIVLPDMDGKSVYPHIMEARPNLKVLVCSGYSIDGPAQEILSEGAQDFIQKPFGLAEISEKLKKVLEQE